jgi:hypothetical protein
MTMPGPLAHSPPRFQPQLHLRAPPSPPAPNPPHPPNPPTPHPPPQGSMNMSYDAANLTTPDIKWLGVRPSDLDRFNIPQQCRLPMTAEDIKTGEKLVRGGWGEGGQGRGRGGGRHPPAVPAADDRRRYQDGGEAGRWGSRGGMRGAGAARLSALNLRSSSPPLPLSFPPVSRPYPLHTHPAERGLHPGQPPPPPPPSSLPPPPAE